MLTLADARRMMAAGRPWTFRMEFYGQTNAGNLSRKFWMATGRARNEPIEIHYGAIGAKPQILVKTWDYVEKMAPAKEAKGYCFADTPFVRIRRAVISAFKAGGMTAALAYGAKAPKTPGPCRSHGHLTCMWCGGAPSGFCPSRPSPSTAPANLSLSYWRCDTGGITMKIKGSVIEIVFDKFPADWQGAAYGTFKDHLEAFCSGHLGRKVTVHWSGDDSEVFAVRSIDIGLFAALIHWFQAQIGAAASPMVPPTKLTGPYAKVVKVKRMASGAWYALSALDDRMMTLTKEGARDLVAEYPHITVVGL